MQRVNEHDQEYRDGDHGVKYMFRGPNIDWGVIRILPGAELGRHYHSKVEETFYFLRGEPKMVVDETEHRVRQGDAFRVEAPEKHNVVNDTDQAVFLVFTKFPYDPKDKVNA